LKLKISLSSSILIVDREGNPTLDVCLLFLLKGINENLKGNYKYPLKVLMIYVITILYRKMKLKLYKTLGGFLL